MDQQGVKVHPLLGEAILKDIDSHFVLDAAASSVLTSAIENIINSVIEEQKQEDRAKEER